MARNTLIDFLEYNRREDLVSKVAETLSTDLISSIKGGGNTIFSVPGGSTQGLFLTSFVNLIWTGKE